MKRTLGFVVFVVLLGGAVTIGLASRPVSPVTTDCVSALQLCADEAQVLVDVLVERCSGREQCRTRPYKDYVFLGFIALEGGVDACGPGECGAAIHALQSGWASGHWQIVAPRLRRFPHLTPPKPIEVDLQAGETYRLELVYRDAEKD